MGEVNPFAQEAIRQEVAALMQLQLADGIAAEDALGPGPAYGDGLPALGAGREPEQEPERRVS